MTIKDFAFRWEFLGELVEHRVAFKPAGVGYVHLQQLPRLGQSNWKSLKEKRKNPPTDPAGKVEVVIASSCTHTVNPMNFGEWQDSKAVARKAFEELVDAIHLPGRKMFRWDNPSGGFPEIGARTDALLVDLERLDAVHVHRRFGGNHLSLQFTSSPTWFVQFHLGPDIDEAEQLYLALLQAWRG